MNPYLDGLGQMAARGQAQGQAWQQSHPSPMARAYGSNRDAMMNQPIQARGMPFAQQQARMGGQQGGGMGYGQAIGQGGFAPQGGGFGYGLQQAQANQGGVVGAAAAGQNVGGYGQQQAINAQQRGGYGQGLQAVQNQPMQARGAPALGQHQGGGFAPQGGGMGGFGRPNALQQAWGGGR